MKEKNQILAIESSFSELANSFGLNFDDIIEVLKIRDKEIPATIFNSPLGPLENIVRYLRENHGLKYSQIAALLNKDKGVIGVTYRNAVRKYSGQLIVTSDQTIPLSKFYGEKFSIFEILVSYLKQKLSYREIGKILNRNERTIWTIYQRHLKKNEKI